jgi:hypothetical protein
LPSTIVRGAPAGRCTVFLRAIRVVDLHALLSERYPKERRMGDTAIAGVDHHSATQPPAGEMTQNWAKTSVLLFVAVSAVSFVVCLASFAIRQIDLGVSAASVTLFAAGASMAWRAAEARRARQVQRDWDSTRHAVAA